MANRKFDSPHVIGERLIEIVGSFAPLGGAGTIDPTLVKGFGFGYAPTAGAMALQSTIPVRQGITSTPGIVRTTTGIYTLTLDDSYIDCILWETHLVRPATSTSSGYATMITAPTNLGVAGLAPTFTLAIGATLGTPSDLGTTYRVGFRLWLRDSTTQYGKP